MKNADTESIGDYSEKLRIDCGVLERAGCAGQPSFFIGMVFR